MTAYEIVAKFYNACAGISRPQTFFEEATLTDTDAYIREKHGREFAGFQKESLPDGRVVYRCDHGSVTYVYEFTPLE